MTWMEGMSVARADPQSLRGVHERVDDARVKRHRSANRKSDEKNGRCVLG